jgi:hypothetical protein
VEKHDKNLYGVLSHGAEGPARGGIVTGVPDFATQLAHDHAELYDAVVARRYFAKFAGITGHLGRVAAELEVEGRLSRPEIRVISGNLDGIARSFRALSLKYLMTGRTEGPLPGRLVFDRHESGFPVFAELLTMANDAAQAARHLEQLPDEAALRDAMVRQIVGERTLPTRLQFTLSQRLYYEALAAGGLFWARNDPEALWRADAPGGRRLYLVHWAVYDSQVNLPVLYLMEVEDSGRRALPLDIGRWPEVQAHLMAQSVAGLKLVTIADGFDRDFSDLHPKRLRRIHLGPMYSHAFTLQSGPIREVLEEARAPEGEDWALVWTVEDLNPNGSRPSGAAGSAGWSGRSSRWTPLRAAAPTPAPRAPSARSSCRSGCIRCWRSGRRRGSRRCASSWWARVGGC